MVVTRTCLGLTLLLSYLSSVRSQVCDGNTTDGNGVITSPNYPELYPNNAACTWELNVESGRGIRIQFTDFDLEKDVDFVRIYDSAKLTFTTPFKGYTGTQRPKPSTWGNHVTLTFKSDEIGQFRGFRALVTSMKVGPKRPLTYNPSSSKCKKTLRGSGVIVSPNFPNSYPNGVTCKWTLVADADKSVQMEFIEFATEDHWDTLRVLSPSASTTPVTLFATFTGVVENKTEVFGRRVDLLFQSDKSITKGGFKIIFTSISKSLTTAGTVTTRVPVFGNCGIPAVQPKVGSNRIVGGTAVTAHSWPWQAALVYSGNFICGATLLSSDWIVTAAHCILGDPQDAATKLEIILGAYNSSFDDSGHVRIRVKEVFRHPDYDNVTDERDIALIQLQSSVVFNQIISPICLPSVDAAAGTRCYATGWGQTLGTGGEGALKQVALPIVDRVACYDYLGADFTQDMLCAGYITGGQDTCQGDSGGPFACEINGRFELQGVTSWGDGCAEPFYPGVYTRVSRFVNWIQSVMSAN